MPFPFNYSQRLCHPLICKICFMLMFTCCDFYSRLLSQDYSTSFCTSLILRLVGLFVLTLIKIIFIKTVLVQLNKCSDGSQVLLFIEWLCYSIINIWESFSPVAQPSCSLQVVLDTSKIKGYKHYFSHKFPECGLYIKKKWIMNKSICNESCCNNGVFNHHFIHRILLPWLYIILSLSFNFFIYPFTL